MQLDATIDDVSSWQSQRRHRLWRRVAYKAESCFCLAVHAYSTLACIRGALWARRCKRGILLEARDEGKRKNKAPVKSPLFWLFRPPTPTNRELQQQRRRRLQKRHLKSEFALPQTLSRLFHLVYFVKWCWQMFLELNSKGLYQSSGKEKKVVVLFSRPRQNVNSGAFTL